MRPHGKWSDSGIPHRGWVCVGFEDLGAPDETCQMCERQEIRYVHEMQHPDHHAVLRVGCDCAGRMEDDYAAAERREKEGKNLSRRRVSWLNRTWKISAQGNEYIRVDGFHIVVYQAGSIWRARITDRHTDNSLVSKKPYPSADQVKLAAFDAMLLLKRKWRGE